MNKEKMFNILSEVAGVTGLMFLYRMIMTKSINVEVSVDFLILVTTLSTASILGKKLARKHNLFKGEVVNSLTFNFGIVIIGAIFGAALESAFNLQSLFMVNGIVACIASLIFGVGIHMKGIEESTK